MITTKYPNRDALYAAHTIYRDAMRQFMINCLKKNGDTPENLIREALPHLDPRIPLRNESDAVAAIDINNFPDIIEKYWGSVVCFSEEFNANRSVLNETKRIADGRSHWAHPGMEDTGRDATLKMLWLITEFLGRISEPDAKSEVEDIRDQLCPNDSEIRLAVMSNRWETAEAELTALKRHLVATEERLAVTEAEKTAAEVQLTDISNIVVDESFRNNDHRKTAGTSDEQLESEPIQEITKVPSKLKIGQWVKGKVKNITAFGAFVDLGGIDGLIRIPELTWERINSPSDVVSLDEDINVKVINIDRETEKGKTRIDLRLKPKPWEDSDVEADYPIGTRVQGIVTNIVHYGVFLKLKEGLTGMIHESELSWKPNDMVPSDFNEGQELEAKVIDILKEERISLSLKQLEQNPCEL